MFEQGLEQFTSGDLAQSRATLAALQEQQPQNLVVGRWLQEVELAIGRDAARQSAQENPDAEEHQKAALRRRYRERAEADPVPARLVLAARLEDDPPAALHLLERALEIDPTCAWAHYGRAHVQASTGRWGEAREEIRLAFENDPAHLPTLRLHAWMLARSGKRQEAIAALDAWLEHAAGDARFALRSRDEARLDLALLLLAEGRAQEAGLQLDTLHPGTVEEVRRLSAQVAVEHSSGREETARETSRAAQRTDPAAILPVVQEALLLEYWLRAPGEAERVWRRALELAGDSDELGALIQRMRAQVHLGRLARQSEQAEAAAGSDRE